MRNADGHICGAEHHRTRIPDAVVLKLRDLYDEGAISIRDLAERFHVPRSTVHKIVTYQIRCYVRPEPYDA